MHKLSVPQRKTHRIGVFVDVQNMYHSAKNLYRARVNFKELLKEVTSGRELVRALAYVVKSDTPEERAFFDALEKSGLELKSKDLQVFPGGMKKADWDVGLAIDTISLSRQLDVVVIVSGDGDFEPLIRYLQHEGLIVEVAGFRRSTSSKIIETSDNFIDLDLEASKVILRAGKPARPSRGINPKRNQPEKPDQNQNQESYRESKPKGYFMEPANSLPFEPRPDGESEGEGLVSSLDQAQDLDQDLDQM